MYERLVELCGLKGISITKLCVWVTGSKGNLATWKKGNMNIVCLRRCAEVLDASTDYILGIEKSPTAVKRGDIAAALQSLSEEEIDELINYTEYLKFKRKK